MFPPLRICGLKDIVKLDIEYQVEKGLIAIYSIKH